MSDQQSKAEYQESKAQPETTEGEGELDRLEARLREIMNDETIRIGLGRIGVLHRDDDDGPSYMVAPPGMPTPYDYRDQEIKNLEGTISDLRQRHRNDYQNNEVLRHVARAEGLIEGGGECVKIFHEVLLAIQFLVNRD